jgi:hypothetical protein
MSKSRSNSSDSSLSSLDLSPIRPVLATPQKPVGDDITFMFTPEGPRQPNSLGDLNMDARHDSFDEGSVLRPEDSFEGGSRFGDDEHEGFDSPILGSLGPTADDSMAMDTAMLAADTEQSPLNSPFKRQVDHQDLINRSVVFSPSGGEEALESEDLYSYLMNEVSSSKIWERAVQADFIARIKDSYNICQVITALAMEAKLQENPNDPLVQVRKLGNFETSRLLPGLLKEDNILKKIAEYIYNNKLFDIMLSDLKFIHDWQYALPPALYADLWHECYRLKLEDCFSKIKPLEIGTIRNEEIIKVKTEFNSAILDLQRKTIADFTSKKLAFDSAMLIADQTLELTKNVSGMNGKTAIQTFHSNTKHFQTTWSWRCVFGAVIGAAIGLVAGFMMGVWGGPLVGLTGALYGASQGAIMAATLLGASVGTLTGLSFGIWRTRMNDPVTQVMATAEQVVTKSLKSPA